MFVCLFAITYVATKYRRRQKKPQKKKNALSPLSAMNTLPRDLCRFYCFTRILKFAFMVADSLV